MIASPAATATEIILDVVTDNWSSWHQALKQQCFTKFGEAGQQILSNATIPLYPFATEPTKDDLLLDPTGTPTPGAFVYSRRSLTLTEAATTPPIDQTPIPLSTQGNCCVSPDSRFSARRLVRISISTQPDFWQSFHKPFSTVIPSRKSILSSATCSR